MVLNYFPCTAKPSNDIREKEDKKEERGGGGDKGKGQGRAAKMNTKHFLACTILSTFAPALLELYNESPSRTLVRVQVLTQEGWARPESLHL